MSILYFYLTISCEIDFSVTQRGKQWPRLDLIVLCPSTRCNRWGINCFKNYEIWCKRFNQTVTISPLPVSHLLCRWKRKKMSWIYSYNKLRHFTGNTALSWGHDGKFQLCHLSRAALTTSQPQSLLMLGRYSTQQQSSTSSNNSFLCSSFVFKIWNGGHFLNQVWFW